MTPALYPMTAVIPAAPAAELFEAHKAKLRLGRPTWTCYFCFEKNDTKAVTTLRRLCDGCEERERDNEELENGFIPSCDQCGSCNGYLVCKWCAFDRR